MTQIFKINYDKGCRCGSFPLLRVSNEEKVQKRPFQVSETQRSPKIMGQSGVRTHI